eukprot:CAMPEP_0118973094 /NCGR_PEP_ID=MMETSP1173-20130426/9194_1 /TAXON_ID=1034831 /ORGANISM="Rhizochromulina marina cf, Strain CCMP1243" /LENGTH=520 /DNA_ID=CAMNT_0006922701 /DNA_START=18 /DNA_END=1580 /DNA_ORIENTATION=-
MSGMEVEKGAEKVSAEEKKEEGGAQEVQAAPQERPRGGIEDVRHIVAMIEKAVATNQTRLISRALRHNTAVRTKATKVLLTKASDELLPDGHELQARLMEQISALPDPPADMALDGGAAEDEAAAAAGEEKKMEEDEAPPAKRTSIIPEVEVYLSLLVVTTLLRHNLVDEARTAAEALFLYVGTLNRRSLDPLRAKVYFYLSLAHEQKGSLAAIRPHLMAAHRTACLQHDEMGQATLLNLLLRDLLHHNQVEQAYKLVSKTNFPEKASNNQFCRYLYYTGRIAAIQLEYGDAYNKLLQAIRKAPQNTAVGFRRIVQKLMVIVQLLMGEVPERTVFNQPEFRGALAPYLALTKAVRVGDLMQFNQVLEKFTETFKLDETYTLVVRLSHNVVKAGLRRINVSYSRISMADISRKLHLESPQSAELVCAKAIRDGVIDAELDHEHGWMQSNELSNVYATTEPERAFHKRTEFCLDVHNEAVKAMRYAADAYKKEKKDEQEPDKTEEEIVQEIEEELGEEEGGL